MNGKPKLIYFLICLWIALSGIFLLWGGFSLSVLVYIPDWPKLHELGIAPSVFFGYLLSTLVWFVFSSLFIIFAYGTYKGDKWVWSTSLIISTIFIIIFGFMLAAFIVTSILFLGDLFSLSGLISVVLSFLTDLGIIFIITRPKIKLLFAGIELDQKN